MTDRAVTHSTFTLERVYDVPPARAFAAWSDPATKARWFAAGGDHELDFRVGGTEVNRARGDEGQLLTFESRYQEIVAGERIVYTSTLSAEEDVVTVSLTTVGFEADGEGALLVLTEHGAFLDGHEEPAWREQGTGDWLDALGAELRDVTS